ncbi:MAG: hypothetical protein ACOZNI_00140 [Myxococcota bacterium]
MTPVRHAGAPALLALVVRAGSACTPTPAGDPPGEGLEAGPDCVEDGDWPVDEAANVLGARVVAGVADEDDLAALRIVVDGLRERRGPWAHHVEGPWREAAGGTFVAEGAESLAYASVPEGVVDDEGRPWLFFVDGDLDAMMAKAEAGEPMRAGWGGVAGLAAARWSEDGTWERVEVEVVGDDVPLLIVDPDILRLPDGSWRMYTLSVPADEACADRVNPAGMPAPHRVWAYRSDDLVEWTSIGTVYEASERTTDPGVWCRGDTCGLMVSAGTTPPEAALSADGGRSFVASPVEVPEGSLGMPDFLVREDRETWMISQTDGQALRALSSTDGRVWVEDTGPGLAGEGPTVIEHDGDVLLWIHVSSW